MGMNGQKADDWVKKENGFIYWDENAVSNETTKEGEIYLGKSYFNEFGNSGFGEMYYADRTKEMIKTVSTITITPQNKEINNTVQNAVTSSALTVSKSEMFLNPKVRTKLKYHTFTTGEGFYNSLNRLGKVKTPIGYIDGKTAYIGSKSLKWASRGLGAASYGISTNQWLNGDINNVAYSIEMTSASISNFTPPIVSIPWTIGYEGLGRNGVARIPYYQNQIRPFIYNNFWVPIYNLGE